MVVVQPSTPARPLPFPSPSPRPTMLPGAMCVCLVKVGLRSKDSEEEGLRLRSMKRE
ncbi:uncharacterized protein DS421_2g47590 [Arachis hypogaea]|nr:uncharacterized protein DS421_2g47590 [Arachis hypogaea]